MFQHQQVARHTRRRTIQGAAALGLGAALAACGPAGGSPTEPAPQAKVDLSKVNRKLLVWSERSVARSAQVARWTEQHPNLPAEMTDIGTGGQGSEAITKFLAAVAAGDVADVVRFDRFQIGSYTHRGAFTPLDPYQKADKFDLKRFVDSAVEEAHGLDKKLYGIPTSTDNRPFFWK